MALEIEWSEEAKIIYLSILEWLHFKWSLNDVQNFIRKTEKVLFTLRHQPNIYKSSSHKNIRQALVTKQTSIIYIVKDSKIFLITFWDTRQNPAKLKY